MAALKETVSAVESIDDPFHKVEWSFVWKLFFEQVDLGMGFFLLTASEIDHYHQNPSLHDIRIVEECLAESRLGERIVFGFAHSLKHSVGVAGPQAAVCKGEVRIEFDGLLEILYRGVAVFFRKCSEDKPTEIIPAAQIFFPGLMIFGCTAAKLLSFFVSQLKPEAFKDPLGDLVLQKQNVVAFGVDPIAPKNVACGNIYELSSDTDPISAAQETRGQNGMNSLLAAGLSGVDIRTLILRDYRTRPNHERTQLG